MSFFTRVVVAVDASPASRIAVEVGISLARLDGCDVVFGVAIDPALVAQDYGFAAFGEFAQREARELLDAALSDAQTAGVAARGEIFFDNPADGMIALAESSGAKLLMVARDPARSTIIGTFLGSIADQVLRRSTVPVCIVRRPAVGKFYHRVLVPIAGDELYRRAVAYAVTLAQAQEATLIFCTIGGDPRACEERLSWAHSYAKEHNVVAEQRTIGAGGKIGDAICQQAGLESCDAIVMATHGRSGLPRLIEGSTAEAVVHSSDVPVLVVK